MTLNTLHLGQVLITCRMYICSYAKILRKKYFIPLAWLLNNLRVSKKGTDAAEWDRKTWPELKTLAAEHPESGVHFQGPL